MSVPVPSGLEQFDGQLLDGLDFCAAVYRFFEEIRASENGVSRLRLRGDNPVEKKLIEELLPVAKYVQTHYRPGRYISVRWINGYQSGDAEIEQRGSYIDQGYFPSKAWIEVTTACHPNEHLGRKSLETNGGYFGVSGLRQLKDGSIHSEPVVHRNQDYVGVFVEFVAKVLRKKASIAYPVNTTLIIACELDTLYVSDDWEKLLADVRLQKIEHSFEAIFLHDTTRDRFDRL